MEKRSATIGGRRYRNFIKRKDDFAKMSSVQLYSFIRKISAAPFLFGCRMGSIVFCLEHNEPQIIG